MNIVQRAILRLAGVKDLAALHPEAFTRELLFSGYSTSATADSTAPMSNAYGEYMSQPWIYKATRTVALAFRQVPLYVMRGEEYVEGHPVEELLARPNPAMTGSSLWERWITDVYLSGEIGLEAVGRGATVVELWPRRGLNVTVSHGSRYPVATSYTIKDGQGDYRLAPEEFIWAWMYNPLRDFRGLGIFQAAALGIRTDAAAQKYAASFFKGMARPDYVVTTPQGTTITEQNMLLAQIEAMTTGRNKGIVMEQGITDIKPLSFAPKDIIWETIRQMSREEVGAVAGVPGELMGDKNATYENRKEATKSFWFDTMQPLCRWRDELLTSFFRARGSLRPDEEIESDFSDVEALEQSYGDRIAYATSLVALGVSLADVNTMLDLHIPDTSLAAAAAAPQQSPVSASMTGARVKYDDSQPRDEAGRWTSDGGGGASGSAGGSPGGSSGDVGGINTSPDKPTFRDNIDQTPAPKDPVERRAFIEQTVNIHGLDPTIKVNMSTDQPSFKLNNKEYLYAGWYDPSTGEVTIFEDAWSTKGFAQGLIAHELEHAAFDRAEQAYNTEVRKAQQLERQLSETAGKRQSVIRLDGRIKDEYADMFPAINDLAPYFNPGEEAKALEKSDGVTQYSQNYWVQYGNYQSGSNYRAAHNETLAEIAYLKATGQLKEAKVRPVWKQFSAAIKKHGRGKWEPPK